MEKIHHDQNNTADLYNYVRISQLLSDAILVAEDIVDGKTNDLTIATAKQVAEDRMIDMEVNKSFLIPMMVYRQKLLQSKTTTILPNKGNGEK